MKFIRYEDISVKALLGNPKNPRKDLGDLSELTESIRNNGIYQELTVVPHGQNNVSGQWIDAYMVIIGHRRLAAAKAAGLEKVPCKVVEMSEREMQTTMLTENVQRSDLTPLEEAEGIQMCLDLGVPESEIVEKAGMSKNKIRTRKILLKYNRSFVDDSFRKGMTLQDYIDAEKIRDEKTRNKLILNYGGTKDFQYKLETELNKQKAEHVKQMVLEKISPYAEHIPKDVNEWNLDFVAYFAIPGTTADEVNQKIEEKLPVLQSGKKIYYTVTSYGIYLKKEPDPKAAPQKSLEQKQIEESERQLEADMDIALKCRIKFMKDLKGYLPQNQHEAKKHSIVYIVNRLANYWTGIRVPASIAEEFFGTKDASNAEEVIGKLYDQRPVYAVIFLEWILRETTLQRYGRTIWNFNAEYKAEKAAPAKELYAFLEQYNYTISTVERQLIDGTHPSYRKPEAE